MVVAEKIDVFRGFVDKERVSLPLRSPKLFTLGALRDATVGLLGEVKDADFDEKQLLAIDFWNVVADNIPEWTKVKDGDMKPIELRQEYIHTHAVVLWGIGSAGKAIIAEHPDDWNKKMEGLRPSTGAARTKNGKASRCKAPTLSIAAKVESIPRRSSN